MSIKYQIYRYLFLSFSGLVISLSIFPQKAFPDAVGFGKSTRGAYSGSNTPEILIVDDLSGDHLQTGENRGTFSWCLSRGYPRIIVFEVGGVIDYKGVTKRLNIENPYVSIFGQTAPYSGIIIKSATVQVQTNDVVIQHIKFRVGDDAEGEEPNSRDCLEIRNGRNIIIDHCSFSWSIDELVSIAKGEATNITLSNNIIGEALDKSLHFDDGKPERHSYGTLTYTGDISFVRNLFAFTFGRNPMLRPGKKAVVNNLIYAAQYAGPMIYAYEEQDLLASIMGNHIINMSLEEFSEYDVANYAVNVINDMTPDSRLFVDDNLCNAKIDNPSLSEWDLVYRNHKIIQTQSSPIDLSGYNIIPANELEDMILTFVGALYWNRDYVDQRIINHVKNRTGTLLNSPLSMPAMAYNWRFTDMSGDLSNGHDWSGSPENMVINGTSILLDQRFNNIVEIVDYINKNCPVGVEAYRLNSYTELNYIGIRTKETGASQVLTLSGSGLETLGIPEGTFTGSDGRGYDFGSSSHQLALPAEPHSDIDQNGYTELQEWIWNISAEYEVSDSLDSAQPDNPDTIRWNDNWSELPAYNIETSGYQDPHAPEKTVDDDLNTRWSAEGEQWIQFDLGHEHLLYGIQMAWYRGNERRSVFDLYTSSDGENWKPILKDFKACGTSLSVESIPLNKSHARYVKLAGHGNNINDWNSLTEIKFWGEEKIIEQKIELKQGWNLISLYIKSKNMDPESLFADYIHSGIIQKISDEAGRLLFSPEAKILFNSLGELKNERAYYIYSTKDCELSLFGHSIELPTHFKFKKGINLIGFPIQDTLEPEKIFKTLISEDKLIMIEDQQCNRFYKSGNTWINEIGRLKPGSGYKIFVSEDVILRFAPLYKKTHAQVSSSLVSPLSELNYFDVGYQGNPIMPMNFIFNQEIIASLGLSSGDELAVFQEEKCVGKYIYDGEKSFSIAAGMQDHETSQTDGYQAGSGFNIKYWNNRLHLESDLIQLKPNIQFDTIFKELGTAVMGINSGISLSNRNAEILNKPLIRTWPNPFVNDIHIEVKGLSEPVECIQIYNLQGQLVWYLSDPIPTNDGHIYIRLDPSDDSGNMPAGIYIVSVLSGNMKLTARIIKSQ